MSKYVITTEFFATRYLRRKKGLSFILTIPSEWVRMLGWEAGDIIILIRKGNEIILRKEPKVVRK